MKKSTGIPITFLNHPHQEKLRMLLFELLAHPDPQKIVDRAAGFLRQYPLPLDDFPRLEETYSRTIVHRNTNGFEAMAARWSKGAISSIHGHPAFTFYSVIEGRLKIDNYRRDETGVTLESSVSLGKNEHFFFIGSPGRFDNNIHQVQASEETLSLHISSDDSAKGEVFHRIHELAPENQYPHYAGVPLPLCLCSAQSCALELLSA